MRGKIFRLLRDEIIKLPKDNISKYTATSKVRHLHAMSVVLFTMVDQMNWIKWKIYSSDDFIDMFDATNRVQHVMTALIRDGEFVQSKDVCKLFGNFHRCIIFIDEENEWERMFKEDGLTRTRFFAQRFLKKLSDYEQVLTEKFGAEVPVARN